MTSEVGDVIRSESSSEVVYIHAYIHTYIHTYTHTVTPRAQNKMQNLPVEHASNCAHRDGQPKRANKAEHERHDDDVGKCNQNNWSSPVSISKHAPRVRSESSASHNCTACTSTSDDKPGRDSCGRFDDCQAILLQAKQPEVTLSYIYM
jgi:hypothetical protein